MNLKDKARFLEIHPEHGVWQVNIRAILIMNGVQKAIDGFENKHEVMIILKGKKINFKALACNSTMPLE